MASSSNDFNFSEAYRNLQPTADRSITAARENAHRALRAEAPKSVQKLVDLTRLAFGLPVPEESALEEWFEKPVRKKDAHFSLQIDKEEAARIATLVLSDIIQSRYPSTPALVIAASFSGRRSSPDNGKIVLDAKRALAEAARNRGLSFNAKIDPPQSQDVSKTINAAAASLDSDTVKTALAAVNGEAKSLTSRLIVNINNALQALTAENRRLAEEVDLLWWHLGGYSYVLDRPLSEFDDLALPLVVGNDVAAMVNVLPGPHGALGIIKRALGSTALNEQKISETLKALPSESRPAFLGGGASGANDIAVLNFGVKTLVDEGTGALGRSFQKITGFSGETKLTRYQIALQAYYERLFIKHGWL
ncbi:GTPase-associated system all-helical protein GASH [Microvirga puerhi]|uniref:GTPase-associated system helical domain-containing protein n=1 Tax=Microvirga puerhi TaxID=2876078 RepID=A0ABS7VR35_9HYPH|nr:GTPase-associated system all-helical protein GASH [Microvirga puerhi]MBZ6077575.1 hypothetical protein [Microvirga puerhi]